MTSNTHVFHELMGTATTDGVNRKIITKCDKCNNRRTNYISLNCINITGAPIKLA